MVIDSWLPNGLLLPDGKKYQQALFEGEGWQIIETKCGVRVLLADDCLSLRWIDSGLIEPRSTIHFDFDNKRLCLISSSLNQALYPVLSGKSPNSKSEALSFAQAFKITRDILPEVSLQDAIYIECINRLLPTYTINDHMDDELILGSWLTGGANISVKYFRGLCQALSWLEATHVRDIIEASGFDVSENTISNLQKNSLSPQVLTNQNSSRDDQDIARGDNNKRFELPGRHQLENFINEHIVDIIQNKGRYKLFGIGFPSAVILHGPTGCGKTHAVDQLIEFLGWPSFKVDASTVASPYIHETSKKIADIFDKSIQYAPSILVIDEMEAFLVDRDRADGQHRIEEIAEFLKRIPEAIKNEVLIVAMTNKIDMIDPAILRRGRFDHILKVDYPSESDVLSLLNKILLSLPKDENVDMASIAKMLIGRPLSDVAFVVREGARLAARAGKDQLSQFHLLAALNKSTLREKS